MGPFDDGAIRPLRIAEHPWLPLARIDDVVSQYEPIRVRPFTFPTQKAELIGPTATAAGVAHLLLSGFKVTPRFVHS